MHFIIAVTCIYIYCKSSLIPMIEICNIHVYTKEVGCAYQKYSIAG